MTVTIPLQTDVVYGPIHSRRFGSSLGINLLGRRKVCSFDCVYCQYGHTDYRERAQFPGLHQIEDEVTEALSFAEKEKTPLNWIMIAGNGEPTLHPHFDLIVDVLKRLRDRYLFDVPIGILSNASTCHRPETQDALLRLDGRFMKLDAGNPAIFSRVNQPASPDSLSRIVAGLYQLRRLVIQSLFVNGAVDNTSDAAVEDWIRVIDYVRPDSVQVYTTDRPTAQEGIEAVPLERLQEIAARLFQKTRIRATVS